ncbi:VQ domain-containing protein [Dioscorea alata]|uniref:VQ domain-containing protein n=1 Tax=Dioscorea alata TaxID=55571 RepID=A0ACB7VEU4_DIOAL|nr:VQ domain-containing protein [Dioscorea alata]
MAENCLGLESWAWIPNSFAFETEAVTKALQVSLSDDSSGSSPPPPLHLLPRPDPLLHGSGSETPQRTRNPPGLQTGRIAKRKSRASRRPTTTFITADPANFRAMVQQVTGARFGPDDGPVFCKPEPVRAGLDRVGFGSSAAQLSCLPTLDTSSAFLLDRVGVVGPDGSNGPVCGFEYEPVLSFPTLDSWAAM